MPRLNSRLSAVFELIRIERIYFLLILLGLTLVFTSEPVFVHESKVSDKVQALQASAKAFETDSVAKGLQLFMSHPVIIISACALLGVFFLLLVGGSLLVVLYEMMPSFRDWFFRDFDKQTIFDISSAGRVAFRAATLIFFMVTAVGSILGELTAGQDSSGHIWPMIHTLMIDLLVCLSVYAAMRTAGFSMRFVFNVDPISITDEIKRGLIAYVLAFPVFFGSLLLVMCVSAWLHYEPPLHPLVEILTDEQGRSPIVFYGALALATCAAPIMEEVFFRGFVYRLIRTWGKSAAAVVSASFFAALHGSGFAFFPIFILGWILAWLYEKRGSLVACWTFHVMHNILFTTYFLTMKAMLGAGS